MEVGMNEIDDVIEQYKRELLGETELVSDDVKEIEDHLRALTTELRGSGLSAAEAARAACVRVGDPRAVAREHAKVHLPFGTKLSWPRTLSAAALLLFFVIGGYASLISTRVRVPLPMAVTTVLATVVLAALLARLTWARPLILGALGYVAIATILAVIAPPDGPHGTSPLQLIPVVGTLAFVMPWRRGELSRGGYALLLQSFAFIAMANAAARFGLPHVDPPGPERIALVHMAPAALIGFLPALLAVAGAIMRARWAAWASVFAAATLFVSAVEVGRYFIVDFHEFAYAREWLPFTSMLFAGSLAALVAALSNRRSARSNLGTLRYALR